jgi:chemotaxis protein methyltransferase CheR
VAIEDLAKASDDLERIEVQLLLEAIYQHYGFDFRGYALGR